MSSLTELLRKKNRLVIGLMSGTSADGVGAALVRMEGNGLRTRIRQIVSATLPYPRGFREHLLTQSDAATARLDEIARLNVLVGELFAEAASMIARAADTKLSDVDVIGSHGQTIAHFPRPTRMFGRRVTTTMQIGDPSVIAKRTGVVTVGDFRIADIAVGGIGAPLVPYVDYLLFRSPRKSRALLNIGGIANITVLRRGCSPRDVVAFDTGPGNMVIDALAARFFRRKHDAGGRIAAGGEVLPKLLRRLMKHPYLRQRPPKSTGREMFGSRFVEGVLNGSKGARREDLMATASAFTALSVYDAYARFVRPRVRIDELFVSGGGAHNGYVMGVLAGAFGGIRVGRVEELGVSGDAKEAIVFAVLANETLAGNPSNLPRVTGAKRPTVLGKICMP